MVLFRDERQQVWEYTSSFKVKMKRCEKEDNVVQYVGSYWRYSLLRDGTFCKIPNVIKIGKAGCDILCLDNSGIIYVIRDSGHFKLLENIKDFWVGGNEILVRQIDDIYKGYVVVDDELWKYRDPIVPKVDIHFINNVNDHVAKEFDQQVRFHHSSIGLDEMGNLECPHYDEIREYFMQKGKVEFIRESDDDVIVFLKDGSAYVIRYYEKIYYYKILYPFCYPLDYFF